MINMIWAKYSLSEDLDPLEYLWKLLEVQMLYTLSCDLSCWGARVYLISCFTAHVVTRCKTHVTCITPTKGARYRAVHVCFKDLHTQGLQSGSLKRTHI